MDKIKKTAKGINYTAVNAGNLNELKEKIFLKDLTDATSTEISLSVLQTNEEIPFFHSHKKNEETYIILKGKGDFQVDDESFAISEGSIIRVATAGKRNMRNTSGEPMIYVVIQAQEESLEQYSLNDGEIVQQEKMW